MPTYNVFCYDKTNGHQQGWVFFSKENAPNGKAACKKAIENNPWLPWRGKMMAYPVRTNKHKVVRRKIYRGELV